MPLKRVVAKLSAGLSVAAFSTPLNPFGWRARNAASFSGFGSPPGSAGRCASIRARKLLGVRAANACRLSAPERGVAAGGQLEAHREPERVAGLRALAVWHVRADGAVGEPHDGLDRRALEVLGGRQRGGLGRRLEAPAERSRRARGRGGSRARPRPGSLHRVEHALTRCGAPNWSGFWLTGSPPLPRVGGKSKARRTRRASAAASQAVPHGLSITNRHVPSGWRRRTSALRASRRTRSPSGPVPSNDHTPVTRARSSTSRRASPRDRACRSSR